MSHFVIQWPSPRFASFDHAVEEACNTGLPLVMSEESTAIISDTLTIKNNNCNLHISGKLSGNTKPIIQGLGHCVFKLMGKRIKVTLENVSLIHTAQAIQKTEIGGAIFCLNTSIMSMRNCCITSTCGFGVWTVQRAKCYIFQCTVSSNLRSGCVCFGQSSLVIDSSTIRECGQHGICLRGSCTLRMNDSSISHCSVRALYAYDTAHVMLQRCAIEGTVSPEHAAVELNGPESPENRIKHLTQYHTNMRPATSFGVSRRSIDTSTSCLCLLVDGAEHQRCGLVHFEMVDTLFSNNLGRDILCVGQSNAVYSSRRCYYYCTVGDQCVAMRVTAESNALPHPEIALPKRMVFVAYRSQPKQSQRRYDQNLVVKDALGAETSSSDQLSGCWSWSFQRNDDEWVPYSQNVSDFLLEKYRGWIEQQHDKNNKTLAKCDLLHHSEQGEDQNQMEESTVQLPPPMDKYSVNFCKFLQTNTQTFFVRAVRLIQEV